MASRYCGKRDETARAENRELWLRAVSGNEEEEDTCFEKKKARKDSGSLRLKGKEKMMSS